jgi:hypothetical protein
VRATPSHCSYSHAVCNVHGDWCSRAVVDEGARVHHLEHTDFCLALLCVGDGGTTPWADDRVEVNVVLQHTSTHMHMRPTDERLQIRCTARCMKPDGFAYPEPLPYFRKNMPRKQTLPTGVSPKSARPLILFWKHHGSALAEHSSSFLPTASLNQVRPSPQGQPCHAGFVYVQLCR